MPRYEIQYGDEPVLLNCRARSKDEALVEAGVCGSDDAIEVQASGDLAGWERVLINGEPKARIRPHQRMRFRRD